MGKPSRKGCAQPLTSKRKTQLVIEYSYRAREQSPETWIFWVHASNAARFEQGYHEIADRLRIRGRKDPDANVLKLVHDRLQTATESKWILILDSIDNGDFLFQAPSFIQVRQKGGMEIANSQPAAAYLPQNERGSILITTRNRSVALRLAEGSDIIQINPMDSGDATRLFRSKLGRLDDKGDAASLVAALGFMPLAITQAAAYILRRSPRYSVQQYLQEFETSDRKKQSLLSYEQSDLRRNAAASNAIIRIFQISLDYIQETRPSAADVLSLMSFFDRQGIPEALIRKQTETRTFDRESWIGGMHDNESKTGSGNNGEFDEQFESDILTLGAHSLVSFSVDTTTFEMHALVQLAMRGWLRVHGRLESWKQRYIQTLFKEFPTGEYENWEKCLLLFPHTKAAITQCPEGGNSIRQWATLLYNVAWYA